MTKIKKFVIECTEEQLEDLKEVVDYVLNNEQDHFDEWLQECNDDDPDHAAAHIYSMACNAARIEYKEIK